MADGNNLFCEDLMDNENKAKEINEEELKAAYEADRQRRSSAREEDLKAAQDYLGVLLEEIENKNAELEEKKKEAGLLADALIQSEQENVSGRNGRTAPDDIPHGHRWMAAAIIEGLVIIALLICSWLVIRGIKKDYSEDIEKTVQNDVKEENPDRPAVTPEVKTEPETARYTDNLAEIAGNAAVNDEFRCYVESIDGLEYLVFDDGKTKFCYKNEYYLTDKAFRKVLLVEADGKRRVGSFSYGFGEDVKLLCPRKCVIDGQNCYVLSDYAGPGRIPETLRVISESGMTEYYGDDIKDKINGLLRVGFDEGGSPLESAPMLLNVTTSKASYSYGFTEAEYTDITYNEYELPDIDTWFSMEIGEEGIGWRTVVKVGDRYCLGELNGNIALGDGSIYVTGAKFGAYVPANQEDPELMNVIIPAKQIPEKYVTINGRNSERYYVELNENISGCEYDWSRLNSEDSNNWRYFDEDGNTVSIRGIDVSKYQGDIDWKKVAAEGIEFVIVRMGFRGMNEGTLEVDPYFKKNVEGALKAGIKVGIYFFSQAINETEAVEEADFVLDSIKDYNITYPVIFDTERVTTYEARANSLSFAQRTANTKAFCDRVAEAGYTPMIYANTKYMIMGIDLEELENYEKWFAVYSDKITFPYHFSMLQYSESGTISGITGNVDLNISFVDYSKGNGG